MPVPSETKKTRTAIECREHVLGLAKQRRELEEEMLTHMAVLTRNNVDMHESLTDAEDYPRSDINVYEVRHARQRIICLQNDSRKLMSLIEEGITELHSILNRSIVDGIDHQVEESEGPTEDAAVASGSSMNGASSSSSGEGPSSPRTIAKVNFVTEGSPAHISGMRVGDEIVQFGSVTADNMTRFEQIAEVVQHSVDRPVPVKIWRHRSVQELTLTPKLWSGRGLLGCNIIPV